MSGFASTRLNPEFIKYQELVDGFCVWILVFSLLKNGVCTIPTCKSILLLLSFYLTICWFFPKSNLASAGLDRVWEVSQLGIGEAPVNCFLAACLFSMKQMKPSICLARMSAQNHQG
jgi:hypothetical protein